MALEHLEETAHSLENKDESERRDMLLKCAKTSLNSKLLAHYKDFFANLVVEAVE